MDAMINAHVEIFHRIFHVRIELKDWGLGLSVSRSGAAVTVSLGPIHLGYSNINRLQRYFEELISKELDNEQNLSREVGDFGQIDEGSGENRILN